jgi:uncharacterized protein (TIGR03083 family)
MRPQRPERTLTWMKDGTERLLADLAGLPDEALAAPTALPGWTRRHLLAHLAANAGALRNLVYWARTGEERRMYASQQQRDADIAAGAARPSGELRAWVESWGGGAGAPPPPPHERGVPGGRPPGLAEPSAFRSRRTRARLGRYRPGAAGRSWWPGP